MKQPPIIHPFLFGVFPIAVLFSQNTAALSLYQMITPAVIIVILIDILRCILLILFKDRHTTATIASLFIVISFSHGHLERTLGFSFLKTGPLIFLEGIVFIGGLSLLLKTFKKRRKITKLLNAVSALLVIISLAKISYHEIKTQQILLSSKDVLELPALTVASPVPESQKPDIYYLVFSGYPSAVNLIESFLFDNSDLIRYLKQKGFYIAELCRSNYALSYISLASSLNMTYFSPAFDDFRDSADPALFYHLLRDNRVGRFLKSQGYKIIHLGSWYPPTKTDENAIMNLFYHSVIMDEFAALLLEDTLPVAIFNQLNKNGRPQPVTLKGQHIEHARFQFRELEAVPKVISPKFVFAHILLPRYPYVFDKDGNVLGEDSSKALGQRENFLNQLRFTNQKIKWLVDHLLNESKSKPIIIIQADEGPWDFMETIKEASSDFSWRQLEPQTLKKYLRILNAYYLPEEDKRTKFYPTLSPVNSFRLIFNLYFGVDLPLLKDETYISESIHRPYRFIRMTDKLSQP